MKHLSVCVLTKKRLSHIPGQITVDSIDAIELVGLGQCHEENQEQKPQIAKWQKGDRGPLSVFISRHSSPTTLSFLNASKISETYPAKDFQWFQSWSLAALTSSFTDLDLYSLLSSLDLFGISAGILHRSAAWVEILGHLSVHLWATLWKQALKSRNCGEAVWSNMNGTCH